MAKCAAGMAKLVRALASGPVDDKDSNKDGPKASDSASSAQPDMQFSTSALATGFPFLRYTANVSW